MTPFIRWRAGPRRPRGALGIFLGLALAALGSARAPAAHAGGSASFAITVRIASSSPPNPVADLTAASTAEGRVTLSWTSPSDNPSGSVASYLVKRASFSVLDVGGSTTAWWNAAGAASTMSARSPGQAELFVYAGLQPGATLYFAVESLDAGGSRSPIDLGAASGSGQARAVVFNAPPPAPSGFSLAPLSNIDALLSWTDLSPGQKGLDFKEYRVYRAPAGGAFARVASTTGTAFTDAGLAANASYVYYVTACDLGGLESPPSAILTTLVLKYPPMAPMGVSITASGTTALLRWHAVTQLSDGTPFLDPAQPTAAELSGYRVYRSSTPTQGGWTLAASESASVSSRAFAVDGKPWYYRLQAENFIGLSTPSIAVAAGRPGLITTPDPDSFLLLSEESMRALSRDFNGLGADILIRVTYNAADIAGSVVHSLSFVPLLGGVTPIPNFVFPDQNTYELHYQTGAPGAGFTTSAYVPQAEAEHSLAVYWNNGARYLKIFGELNPFRQILSVRTRTLGTYQLRSVMRATAFSFDPKAGVSGRVITPNGDGLNDVLILQFDNPLDSGVEGRVYDLRGGLVAELAPGPRTGTLQWDGKSGGKVVPSGVYVYQLKSEDKVFNGTVVVAR